MNETDGQTDGRTIAKLTVPFPTGGGITSDKVIYLPPTKEEVNAFAPVCLSVSVSVCLLARLLKNACIIIIIIIIIIIKEQIKVT